MRDEAGVKNSSHTLNDSLAAVLMFGRRRDADGSPPCTAPRHVTTTIKADFHGFPTPAVRGDDSEIGN